MKTKLLILLSFLTFNSSYLTPFKQPLLFPAHYAKRSLKALKSNEMHFKINSKYIGTKYEYGGTTSNGIDCSSLTQHIYKDNGISIPRNSRSQSKIGESVPFDSIVKGDLLFFKRSSSGRNTSYISHVAIYIGDNKIMHSTSRGVVVDSIGGVIWKSYYKKRLSICKKIKKIEYII